MSKPIDLQVPSSMAPNVVLTIVDCRETPSPNEDDIEFGLTFPETRMAATFSLDDVRIIRDALTAAIDRWPT